MMQSIEDLIEPITDATASGALRWEEESENRYSVRLPKHAVGVWSGIDEDDGSRWVSVELRGREVSGAVLDSTTASEFSPRYDRLLRFFQAARRSALNVDSVIDSIKQDLAGLSRAKAS